MTNSEQPISFMHFEGVCPFLTCLEIVPHDHPICPKCGAVKWGNAYCDECQKHWSLEDRDRKIAQADRDLKLALAPLVEIRERARMRIMASHLESFHELEKRTASELDKIWQNFNKAARPFEEVYDRVVAEAMEAK